MAKQAERFEWVVKLARIGLIASVGLLTILFARTVAQGVFRVLEAPTAESLIPIVLQIAWEVVAAVWVFVLYGIIRLLAAAEAAATGSVARLARLESILSDQNTEVHKLADLASLSDHAKSLIYRDHEIELMRETVHADLMRQDYQTADAFIDRIEKQFGYTDEAERLRQEVASFRKASEEEKTEGAIRRVKDLMGRREWAQAIRESERLARLFPQSERVAALPDDIKKARAKHKGDLLKAYGQAVSRNDVDLGIELLRELDTYLTPPEADALAESARDVFRKKLHNLGVQFAIFVNDQQWAQAVATGDEIIRDYPNSRMAQEARQKMTQLRSLAEAPQNPAV